ncbi:PSD1 and planctomycete cytochrome C domain-containing protein [Blastopirellula sp. JC732]|uniref:PSD1 and planctomycete cytochrome C domain-containing protein n=1 Tax=Blastopirellula sediminis TaxID=2894196 RepID=A0A9X1SGM4_9BACT|nr:PSD1 and planctomycete cytochrome C domain-containing protein [Blastopirellula sediminis]MCC9608382.1 PSD1 and planctomycete cytochrome C domain-containing protein [Blastopirellula sediminis]MCC9628841.1 PSD1 and planctomycete cytochrome C domain-containing protein [Blastopirellula sediminis]
MLPTATRPLAAISVLLTFALSAAADETIDFRSQVQPILADRCFHCHGPDAKNQESAFRLDSQQNLFADLGGYAAVVPGDLEKSELHARIHSADASALMPPADSNRSLTEEEKRILDLWIQQGAVYQGHWAFSPPERSEVPREAIAASDWSAETKALWSQNPIDAFLARRLIEQKLQPSPEADPATLLRRASLTLTGLLPPPALHDRFVKDPTAENYAAAIDELMRSDAYAERQTLHWLDAARYADTDGYQNDSERTNWPWRDWVIAAMQSNMPFDQFTIEQLAGDMLPGATDSQRLATAFNRNHRQNAEGGALAAEFFVENVIDRVETTSTVWLGLTMGCARCHDHKYDPLSQREFYQLFGYFNNIGEAGVGAGVKANPTIKAHSPLVSVPPELVQNRDAAQQEVAKSREAIDTRMKSWAAAQRERQTERDEEWTAVNVADAMLDGDGKLEVSEHRVVRFSPGGSGLNLAYELKLAPQPSHWTALKIEALADGAFAKPRQLAPSVNGNFVLTNLEVLRGGEPLKLHSVSASFEQASHSAAFAIDDDPKSGWAVFDPQAKGESVALVIRLAQPIDVAADDSLVVRMRFDSQYANHAIGKFQLSATSDPDAGLAESDQFTPAVAAALRKDEGKRTADDWKKIEGFYETIDPPLQKAQGVLDAAQKKLSAASGPEVSVMVMNERSGEPVATYLLNRGLYNEPVKDEPLTRGVPTALVGDEGKQPGDRLELARWMVSRENPLTARTTVNRIWQQHFGVGLVKTANDFGLQGERPSHPELLDWLAVELIESGWDLRHLQRLIVTSAAYRQSSRHSAEQEAVDPTNRLVARGPRFRLDGFAIRDIALQSSGLLVTKLGGPSVKPYQPNGLWEVVAANAGTKYRPDSGDGLYRKSMYTYWKRAVNPPRQTIFDAGGREVCSVQANRTNTPLQALVLMNDPTFIECARNLAQQELLAHKGNEGAAIAAIYRAAIGRDADAETLAILQSNWEFFRNHFAEQTEAASKLIAIGASKADPQIDAQELAAMTAVAHLILNLDEFVTVE